MNKEGISLFELNNKIKHHIETAFPAELWIMAEISELRANQNGHCFLELIEKDANSNNIIAKTRATIWAYTFRMLKPYFETTTGHAFTSGIKVLIKVSVEFQELYGFSLNITDIEPSYTLGDIARKRKEIMEKLESEGISNMNKELEFPRIPKTIAIISSPTAAGYEDFTTQLDNNPYGFKFHYKLFSAIMQGAKAEKSIIEALDRIYQYEDIFDVVVIIRGGGSQTDLNCFDSYWLAYNITQFSLPVISGIGHERDDTIVDLVANTRVKTPTAVANFLIDCFADFSSYLHDIQDSITSEINTVLLNAHNRIENITQNFSPFLKQILKQKHNQLQNLELNTLNKSKNYLLKEKNQLKHLTSSQKFSINKFLNNQTHKLEIFTQFLKYANPENILKKGYSITLKNKKIIKDISQLQKNDAIETRIHNGKIFSKIENIKISTTK